MNKLFITDVLSFSLVDKCVYIQRYSVFCNFLPSYKYIRNM